MIWLFKCDEVFWGDKSRCLSEFKVDEYFLFDEDDINFDITKYNISLYLGTSKYFLLDDSNDDIYLLRSEGVANNRFRKDWKLSIGSDYYNLIKSFYNIELRDRKLKELGI